MGADPANTGALSVHAETYTYPPYDTAWRHARSNAQGTGGYGFAWCEIDQRVSPSNGESSASVSSASMASICGSTYSLIADCTRSRCRSSSPQISRPTTFA